MERLRSRDLQALVEFVRDLYALRDLEAFTGQVGRSLTGVIPADVTGYANFDLRRRTLVLVQDPPVTEVALRVFASHLHTHPLVDYYRRTGDPGAYKISDFITRRQLHRRALYMECVRPLLGGADHQLACTFAASPGRVIGVALSRQLSDFSERERLLLNLLRPHLVQAFQNAQAVDRRSADLRRLREGVDALDCGLVFVRPGGRVRFATGRARAWFAEYFGAHVGPAARLPEALQRWVAAEEAALTRSGDAPPPRAPFVLERDDRSLIARFVGAGEERVVFLEEQRAAQPAELMRLGLSRREAEVLTWVSHGKTNADIAIIIGARTRTVEKHLERIYQKLGVETRTAAAARAHTVS